MKILNKGNIVAPIPSRLALMSTGHWTRKMNVRFFVMLCRSDIGRGFDWRWGSHSYEARIMDVPESTPRRCVRRYRETGILNRRLKTISQRTSNRGAERFTTIFIAKSWRDCRPVRLHAVWGENNCAQTVWRRLLAYRIHHTDQQTHPC